jgi:4-amino-4-deoxy-L-arabinose transferase-like glycosyltransferase
VSRSIPVQPNGPASGWTDTILRLPVYAAARPSLWLGVVAAVFCLLAVGISLTKRPWCDEGWFASIAYSMLHKGVMGMTVLDPHGFVFAPLVPEIADYTYWVMPGYVFMQVAWYKLFGLSLIAMRSISVVWGAVALASWYYIVSHLTNSRVTGLVAALVLSVDQHFIIAGASGRMDMMCSGMSLAGVAAYLRLRGRFHLAIFVACATLAMALLTHPNAIFGAILLLLIVLWHDRHRIRPWTVAIAAGPFILALASWGVYILRAPDVFIAQMQAQQAVPHRFHFDFNVVQQVWGELSGRFASAYRLRSGSILAKITGLPVLLYFLSFFCLLAITSIRKRPGATLIAALAAADFILLSCLQDNWYYLVYILPALSAGVAITATWLWERSTSIRIAAALAVATIFVLNAGLISFRILHNDYENRYRRAVDYLKRHAAPDALIVGSGELAFDFGFDGRVADDCRLGYTSGRRPDYIVLETQYYRFWFPWLATHEPETTRHIRRLLKQDYEKVYDQTSDPFRSLGTSDLPYQIYRLKTPTESI